MEEPNLDKPEPKRYLTANYANSTNSAND